MKFRTGDTVKVTAGKDKGKTGLIIKVFPDKDSVVVQGANMYSKHIKPMFGQPGQRVELERPLATAKIAIINDEGEVDRIRYEVDEKTGEKTRVFAKTGKPVPAPQDVSETETIAKQDEDTDDSEKDSDE